MTQQGKVLYIEPYENVLTERALKYVRSTSNKKMLIDGKFVDAASGRTFPIFNPATGEQIALVPEAEAADVDRAVTAARRAFDSGPWPRMLPVHRQSLLLKLADLIEQARPRNRAARDAESGQARRHRAHR